jgi:hypothetical protein
MNPRTPDKLERAVKDVHAGAMTWKDDSWGLREKLLRKKRRPPDILRCMEAQRFEKSNR